MAKQTNKQIISDVGKDAAAIQKDLDSIAGSLTQSLKALKNTTGETEKIIGSSLNETTNLSKVLLETSDKTVINARERNNLEKNLYNTQKQITSLERQRSELLRRSATATGTERKNLLKVVELLGDAVSYSRDQIENADKLKDIYIDIERNLGLTGKLLEGINKIPIVNKFVDTKKALEAANKQAAEFTGSRWNVLGATLNSLGKSLAKNITDPLVLLSASGGVLKKLYDLFTQVDQQVVDLGRNFGVSKQQATQLYQNFVDVSKQSTNVLMTTRSQIDAYQELNSLTQTNAQISGNNLESYIELTKNVGLTKEAAQSYYQLSILNNKTLKQTSTEIGGQVKSQLFKNKTALSEKSIMEGIAKTTAAQRLSIKGGTDALINSVIQAKKLGIEMSALESISDGLLDFESSIAAEMSAELITGRELNVEAARYYAQTNQTGKLAETIRKDIGTAAEFQKMGRIESQMLAQAYGLSRESLAEMLINGEMLNRLNVSDTDELYKQYAAGKLSLDQIKKRGSEELAQQMKNMSFQERLNSLIEKAKDLFVNQLSKKGGPIDRFTKSLDKWISGGGIDRLVSKLQTAAEMFGKAISYLTDPTVLKILGVVAGISVAKKVLNMIRPLGSKSNPMYVRLDSGLGDVKSPSSSSFNQFLPNSKIMTKNGSYVQNGVAYNKDGYKLSGASANSVIKASGAYTGPGAGMMRGLGKFGVSKLGKFAGGPGGMLAAMAIDPLTSLASGALRESGHEGGADAVDVLGGTASSALTGAAIGSLAGPIGTAVGGILGGAYGLVTGLMDVSERKSDKKKYQRQLQSGAKQATVANMSQYQSDITSKYMSFGSTSDGLEGTDKTNALLENLVNVVSSNRSITMNGNQVGVSQGLESYSMA